MIHRYGQHETSVEKAIKVIGKKSTGWKRGRGYWGDRGL